LLERRKYCMKIISEENIVWKSLHALECWISNVEVVDPNISKSRCQTASPYLQRNYDKLSEIFCLLCPAPRDPLFRCTPRPWASPVSDRRNWNMYTGCPTALQRGDPPWGHAAARNRSLNISDHDICEYNKRTYFWHCPEVCFMTQCAGNWVCFRMGRIISVGLGHLERANLDHLSYCQIYKWLYRRLGLVNGFIDLLYTHDSELQAITAPPVISTIQPAVSSVAVSWQRLLTMEILQLHALRTSLHSLPCRSA
jgi:hypothetical protein